MSEPALFDTETPAPDDATVALVDRLRGVWKEKWVLLRDAVRAHPPAEGSPEEAEALRQFATTMVATLDQLGPGALAVLVTKAQGGVEAMWRREYAETSVDRKLGMRLVGQALTTLADLLQEIRQHIPALPEFTPESVARMTKEIVRVEAWPPSARSLFKLELYTFVAFDLAALDDTGEFCDWARRAVTVAREAMARRHTVPFATASTAAWSGDAIVTHLVLPEADAERIAHLLEHAPAPSDALRAFLRDA